ncbi:MAG: amidohydrolase family protein [Candidatus Binataceae bacterium]
MSTGNKYPTRSAEIRARVGHPIIDSDGHVVEFEPALLDYIRDVGGSKILDRYKTAWDTAFYFRWNHITPAERREFRVPRPVWWPYPAKNTRDRATAALPKLLHERLDEMGLDFTVLNPSQGLFASHIGDDELRQVVCRAFNNYHADIFREFSNRMTPAACVPMHTPEEAIAELEHVASLGLKVVMMAGFVRRPIPGLAKQAPELARHMTWMDNFCLDSEYDYDPVWAKCVALKIAPTFHSFGLNWGMRTSISNFIYNQIGHFAAAAEGICKALFLGGVTRRFPTLKFAFKEGGVGWACSLYCALYERWHKRGLHMLENVNPANLDRVLYRELCRQYGGKFTEGRLDGDLVPSELEGGSGYDPAEWDEWRYCGITGPRDIYYLFVPPFFFGCEGDDRVTGWAFDGKRNPLGARLNAVYGSDLGHYDLLDMRDAAVEAYEGVEHGLMTEADFRDFVFVNAIKLHAGMNPDFFKGTVIEHEAAQVLGELRARGELPDEAVRVDKTTAAAR